MTIEQALAHCGELTPFRIEERVMEAIPHYIWMWGRGKEKSGVCSACHQVMRGKGELEANQWANGDPFLDSMEYDPFIHPYWYKQRKASDGNALHGQAGYCPCCGAPIVYRDMARGHKGLIDRIVYLDYRKSALEENTLCLIGYRVTATWDKELFPEMSANEFSPELWIEPCLICIFRYGKSAFRFIRRRQFIADYDAALRKAVNIRHVLLGWEQKKRVNGNYAPFGPLSSAAHIRHKEDTKAAFADTGFGRVMEMLDGDGQNDSISMIDWMANIARYPQIEYLLKLGMRELSLEVLNGENKRLLNLRGKTAEKVLRISPDCWGWLKGYKKAADRRFLACCHTCDTWKVRAGYDLIWRFSRLQMEEHLLGMIQRLHDPGLVKKAMQYILKKGISARDYLDHLNMMKKLDMGWGEREFLFPADFQEAHARLSMRIQVKEDEAARERMGKMLSQLQGFSFSALGLVLAPIRSIGDVIREGTALHHCVATYANRYADGQIVLCTLREEAEMGLPLYTVEFKKDGVLVQCRGDHNKTRPEDEERLRLFWALFKNMRSQLISQKKKSRQAA